MVVGGWNGDICADDLCEIGHVVGVPKDWRDEWRVEVERVDSFFPGVA